MPSVKNLQLLLAVLLSLSAHSDQVPVFSDTAEQSETSGEEQQNAVVAFEPCKCKWLNITKTLRRDITRLRDEQFQKNFGEPTANMTNYASVRIQTPLLSPSDGCLSKDFSAQRCLKRIYPGLITYRRYLNYVERENLTSAQLTNVKQQTTDLINIIKDKVEDNWVQPTSSQLPDGSAWTQKIVTHSVLYNFEAFLTDTARAINHMNKRGIHTWKELKESRWPSEKHSHE